MFAKVLMILLLPLAASAQEMSLTEFLQKAWQQSPVVRGEKLQNEASEQFIDSVRGKYLPHLSLEAIDTTGFAASNSELGVSGLMGSPFRSGAAGGVVVRQTVYDFGRIQSLLEHAKANRSLAEAGLADEKYRFLSSIAQMYLACARSRSLRQNDEELMEWAKINLKETARFTKTGQRSVVDNALVQTEVDSLKLEMQQLRDLEQSLTGQMKLYGGASSCQSLAAAWRIKIPDDLSVEDPSVLLAKAQIEVAQASSREARADQLPLINVMGSVGDMERTRLVEQKDYSAGIGLVFPVWNGGEDAKREAAFRNQASYQNEHLKAVQLDYIVQIKNLRDEAVRDQQALEVIEKNLAQVQKTIRLASQRYQRLEGPLIDVREAFKQLRAMGLERLRVMNSLAEVTLQLSLWRTK